MSKRPLGKLRIIGGEWRSRLVEFDADHGVRPTPDRVRQTVFDWLTPVIDGARCLDLFAGSGALGLEALSRGARKVTFVETGRLQMALIHDALVKLKAEGRYDLRPMDAAAYLEITATRYNIVFLDPPYGTPELGRALERLPHALLPDNRIYLEWRTGEAPELPAGYEVLKEKQAGQVSFALATYSAQRAGEQS